MNITQPLLKLIARELRLTAGGHPIGSEEADTFMDAADALSDAIDLLAELTLNG